MQRVWEQCSMTYYLGWADGSKVFRSFYLNSEFLPDWMQSCGSPFRCYRWARRADAAACAAQLNASQAGSRGKWEVLKD